MRQKNNQRVADNFLLLAIVALLMSFGSYVLAFPLQVVLVIIAATKARVSLIPAIFVLLLDRSSFHAGDMLKFRFGIALSVQNIFLIAIFVYSLTGFFKKRYDNPTMGSFIPWLSTIVPACAMALPARRQGLAANWQQPFVLFLTPALYYWGISIARSWEEDKDYFLSRMIFIMGIVNIMEFFRMFYIFTFSEHVTMLCLFIAARFMKGHNISKVFAVLGAIFAFGNVTLGRYMSSLNKSGFASSVDLGSTFTRVMVVVFGVGLAILFIRGASRKLMRTLPYYALICCIVIFIYAVGRAKAGALKIEGSDIRTWAERFEYKLIGDRGTLWAASLDETFKSPLFFKNLSDQIVYVQSAQTGTVRQDIKLLPHNQVLTLINNSGWWQGLFCVLFLWWMHVRSFKAASDMLWRKEMLCAMLAPSAAVFIAVGLTGQAVFSSVFCGNGLVAIVYSGIIYGVWQEQERFRTLAPLRYS